MTEQKPIFAPVTFPTIVYRSPGPLAGPPVDGKSTTFATKAIKNDVEFEAAVIAGWWPTVPEAVDPKARLFTQLPDVKVTLDEALEAAENDEPSKTAPVKGDDFADLIAMAHLDDADRFPEPSKPLALADVAVEATETPATIDLGSLSRDDLKAMLKRLDVDFDGRASKETLIDLVVAAQKAG